MIEETGLDRTYIGVDLGIRKIAYAVISDGELISTGAFVSEAVSRMVQLREIALYLCYVIEDLKMAGVDALVMIEKPIIGNNRKYSMQIAETYGAVLSWLSNYETTLRVMAADNKQWKKLVVGNGNANKEQIRNHINVVNERYPALCGHDQDRIDAACIGFYGVMLTARADDFIASMEDAR